MKTVLILSLFAVASTHAFWTACPGLRGPDHVSSPHCGATNCQVVRGEMMHADVTISSPDVHTELMVFGTVFILGIGVPLPQVPP
jgi:hypothetical protein